MKPKPRNSILRAAQRIVTSRQVTPEDILVLQRFAGNRAIQGLLASEQIVLADATRMA